MFSVLGVGLCGLATLLLLLYSRRLRRSPLPLPPGPKGIPLIGNLLQIPSSDVSKFHATETLQKYGDVAHFSVLGNHLIILNSYAAAHDLLFRRSGIYSDRPKLPMAGKLAGVDRTTTLIAYGANWRSQRRVWQQQLNIRALGGFNEPVCREVREFVSRLLADSTDIHGQLKLFVVKTVVSAAFGKTVDSLNDEFVKPAERLSRDLGETVVPGRYFVDMLPFMLNIPSWFPGASWKRLGLKLRERVDQMSTEPYEYVKMTMATGQFPKSFVSEMIQRPYASETSQKWVSGTVYRAAVETTNEAINRFVVAMMANPEVQRRAQEEIDSLTGQTRLPGIQDKGCLPFVDAIIQEVLRWNIILPLSVPHASIQDDEYRGYYIPKGSTIVYNVWTISQDPKQYPSPEKFDPNRYMNNNDKERPMDPRLYCFGIGRRICPGRHLAELTLYNLVVTMLATVNILKPLDDNGNEYMPKIEFEGDIVSAIRPFKARITARSEETRALVKASH